MECRASSGTRCSWLFFFFQAEDGIRDVAVTGVQTCALPISRQSRFWPMHDLLFRHQDGWAKLADPRPMLLALGDSAGADHARLAACLRAHATAARSEEHTSELQSRLHLVCRLLLGKKKKHTI